jgi:hypothetical protein
MFCNEAFNSSSENQVFASPRKTYKRKYDVKDMNDLDKDVGHCMNIMKRGNILQQQS